MTGTLFVVATPIGHLDDITERGANVLRSVEIIAAEDSRRARVLLNHLGVADRTVISLHDHNEADVSRQLEARLQAGEDIALISDAGTPLLSDPGFDLVRRARAASLPVVPVPGASAVTAALSVCPLPSRRFLFEGFLPAKREQRRRRLETLARSPETVVFFEAPHRVLDCFADLDACLGAARPAFFAREMTKRHEEYRAGTVAELRELLQSRPQLKGEFVIIIGPDEREATDAELSRVMEILSRELAPSAAARVGARLTGASRGELYELARRLGHGSDKGAEKVASAP